MISETRDRILFLLVELGKGSLISLGIFALTSAFFVLEIPLFLLTALLLLLDAFVLPFYVILATLLKGWQVKDSRFFSWKVYFMPAIILPLLHSPQEDNYNLIIAFGILKALVFSCYAFAFYDYATAAGSEVENKLPITSPVIIGDTSNNKEKNNFLETVETV